MNPRRLQFSALAALIFCSQCSADPPEPGTGEKDKKTSKPNFTVGKETTYVTGPLDKDGYIDYAAALNERLGKGVTAETNANVLIWKAIGPRFGDREVMPDKFFQLMGMEKPPEKGDYFIELRPYLRDRLGIADPEEVSRVDVQFTSTMKQPWSAKEFPRIAEWLTANEKPLDLVAEGTKRPRYFSPLVPTGEAESMGLNSLLISGGTLWGRPLTTALRVRAMLRIAEGKSDEAWRDLLACQRLGRHLVRGGTMMEGLVGVACDLIGQQGAVTLLDRPDANARQLTGCLSDLRALPVTSTVADQLDGADRFFFLDHFMNSFRSGGPGPAGLDGKARLPAKKPEELEEMDLDAALRRSNQLYDRIAAALREKERGKREAEFDRIEAELKAIQKGRDGGIEPAVGETAAQAVGKGIAEILVKLAIPAVRRMHAAAERNEQSHRNLQIAFALAIYQREQRKYPNALEDLVPKYLDKVPEDLFTGKLLVYRLTEKGFLLYSFGPNGKDDEGRTQADDPKGDDIGIRLPVPPGKK